MRRLRTSISVLAMLVGLVLAGYVLPVTEWSIRLVSFARAAGALGVAVYSVSYFLATVLLLPGSLLTAGAGFAYGPIFGTLLVSPVSVISAMGAFLLGRSVARRFAERKLSKHPKLRSLDTMIEKEGLRAVILLRLSPILPFNLLNYALSLTRVRLFDYVLGSFLGMLPWTFVYVYLGSLVSSASEFGKRGGGRLAVTVLGFVVTAIAAVVLGKMARRALDRRVSSSENRRAA